MAVSTLVIMVCCPASLTDMHRTCRSYSSSKENGEVCCRRRSLRRRNHSQQRPTRNDIGRAVLTRIGHSKIDVYLLRRVNGQMKSSLVLHMSQKSPGLIDMGANSLFTEMTFRLTQMGETATRESRKQVVSLCAGGRRGLVQQVNCFRPN